MSRLNKIILIGLVTDEPSSRATDAGDIVSNFTLSVERQAQEGSPAQFDNVSVVCWKDLAEKVASVATNQMLLVEGSIRTRNYENKEGQRVYVTEVEARDIKVLSSHVYSTAQSKIPAPDFDSAPIPEAPVLESEKAEVVFDFNEAIKANNESGSDVLTQLGEDVPF